jgi:hypothetical protein
MRVVLDCLKWWYHNKRMHENDVDESRPEMKLEEAVLRLFDYSEKLRSVRHELVSTVEGEISGSYRLQVSCAVKEIDIVRVTLLGEYELLDTVQIVRPEYRSAYFARRLEILRMTKAQLGIHLDEMIALGGSIQEAEIVHWIEVAGDLVRSSIEVVDTILDILGGEAIADRKGHTLH